MVFLALPPSPPLWRVPDFDGPLPRKPCFSLRFRGFSRRGYGHETASIRHRYGHNAATEWHGWGRSASPLASMPDSPGHARHGVPCPSPATFPHRDEIRPAPLASTGERPRDSSHGLLPSPLDTSSPPWGPPLVPAPPVAPLPVGVPPPLLLVVAVVALVPSRGSENPACFRRARPLLSPPSPRKGGCGKVRCPARHDNRRADFLASGPKRPHLTAEKALGIVQEGELKKVGLLEKSARQGD